MSKILLFSQHNGYTYVITERDRFTFRPNFGGVYPSQLGEYLGDGIIQLWKNPKGEVWLSEDVKRLTMIWATREKIDITRSETPPPWWLKILVNFLEW